MCVLISNVTFHNLVSIDVELKDPRSQIGIVIHDNNFSQNDDTNLRHVLNVNIKWTV